MRLRTVAGVVSLVAVGCGGESGEGISDAGADTGRGDGGMARQGGGGLLDVDLGALADANRPVLKPPADVTITLSTEGCAKRPDGCGDASSGLGGIQPGGCRVSGYCSPEVRVLFDESGCAAEMTFRVDVNVDLECMETWLGSYRFECVEKEFVIEGVGLCGGP